MTTLPPPSMKKSDANSIDKQVYDLVENLKDYITIPNDRYRLAYNLIKYLQGEADIPEILIKSTKVSYINITETDLVLKINEGLNKIKKG